MPLTFFAHQAPLLPIARRWPHAVDGLALMIGSMGPDLAYVLVGTQWEVRSHELPAAIIVCVPIAIGVAWLVARVLAPVVPDHIAALRVFANLHPASYRGIATHRFKPLRTVVWAAIGSLSHVGIDQFTHEWGWAARNIDWYGRPLGASGIAGRAWTVARIAQYAGHIGLSTLAVVLLVRYTRAGWLRDRAAQVTAFRVTGVSQTVLWGLTVFGAIIAAAVGSIDNPTWLVLFMRVLGGTFLGMSFGAVLVRRGSAH